MNKVVVLGGESFTGSKPDDPSIVHVLDTGKIKYPPDNATTKSGATTGRKSSAPGVVPGSGQQGAAALGAANPGAGPNSGTQRSMSPTAERAASPTQGGSRPPLNGIVGMMNQQTPPTLAEQQQQQAAQQQGSKIMQSTNSQASQQQQQPMRAMSPTQGPGQQARQQQPMQGGLPAAAAGAAVAGSTMAPTQSSLQQRAMSPTAVGPGSTYTGPRSQRSLENMRGVNNITSPTAKTTAFPGVMNGYSNAAAPADGFYQQSMMNGAATSPVAPSAELEATRKREAWLKAALAMAVKKGFVPPEHIAGADAENVRAPDDIDLNGIDTGLEGTDKDRIVRALITLKTKLAAAQVSSPVP